MAAVGAQQNRMEIDQAKSSVLGTLVCKKVSHDTWSGTTKLTKPYGLAHGVSLVQPTSHAEAWEDVTVKGKYTSEEGEPPFEFEQTSNFWPRGSKCEFALPYPSMKSPTLTVEISGLSGMLSENEIELPLINNLCGCEQMLGDILAVIAFVTGLISVVLGFFTMKAFRAHDPMPIPEKRDAE